MREVKIVDAWLCGAHLSHSEARLACLSYPMIIPFIAYDNNRNQALSTYLPTSFLPVCLFTLDRFFSYLYNCAEEAIYLQPIGHLAVFLVLNRPEHVRTCRPP